MITFARTLAALIGALRQRPVRYYVCCDCDRVYQIEFGRQIWQSTLDLSEQLAQFRQSDCARYEERCGQCCIAQPHGIGLARFHRRGHA